MQTDNVKRKREKQHANLHGDDGINALWVSAIVGGLKSREKSVQLLDHHHHQAYVTIIVKLSNKR